MTKNLIYWCIFCNEQYIKLLKLLLISLKLFSNLPNNTDYLILCHPNFRHKITDLFNEMKMKCNFWCLDLSSTFEAGYSRLQIFKYEYISQYTKILYLDCDILITNNLSNILDLNLNNKIYALKEGNTCHHYWGSKFFLDNNPNLEAFTSAVLLFNNHSSIKNLFNITLNHISDHINNNLSIPVCLDQPFIVYNAINNNLYNNTKLNTLVINNPNKNNFINKTVCHFPGSPGKHIPKINKMTSFMNDILMNYNIIKNNFFEIIDDNILIGKIFNWGNHRNAIKFITNEELTAFGIGKYRFINNSLIYACFGGKNHLMKFDKAYSYFFSVRVGDLIIINSS